MNYNLKKHKSFSGLKSLRSPILFMCLLGGATPAWANITGNNAFPIEVQSEVTAPQTVQQNKGQKVTGVVMDGNGESIIGATIMEKGSTTNGTTTNLDGNYEITVKKNAILVVSFVGYATQEIKVGSRTNINITLYEDAQALQEVVVVGYGQQKKSSVVSSINSIGTKQLPCPPAAT